MAVLPESMDRLDFDDVPGSLSKIQDYMRYMGERIEFSMRNVTRSVSAAGVSSAEIYILVQALSQSLAALQSSVNSMTGNITALQSAVGEQSDMLSALQDGVEAQGDDIAALGESLSALTARVETLEEEKQEETEGK